MFRWFTKGFSISSSTSGGNQGSGGSGGASEDDSSSGYNPGRSWFDNIINFFSDIINKISNIPSNVANAFKSFFADVGNKISDFNSNVGEFFNNQWDNTRNFFSNIPDFFKSFWDNFSSFLVGIFVPEDGYFDSLFNDFKQKLADKIPYDTYVNNLDTINNLDTDDISSSDLNVGFGNYRLGDTDVTVSTSDNWVNFDFVLKYKEIWFKWCRAITWLFFIIYNLNQILKLFRGFSISDYTSHSVRSD